MTRRLHRIVRESEVEAYLVKKVRQLGGWAYKFVAPGHRGVPDRLVLWPGGGIEFVELKAPGKKPTLQQMREHARIRRLGQAVTVLDSREAIDSWLERAPDFNDLLGVVPVDAKLGRAISGCKLPQGG